MHTKTRLTGLTDVARRAGSLAVGLVALSACTVIGMREVPISDRSELARSSTSPSSATGARPASPPLVREAREGSYTVQRGDTLYSIALAFGQDWRDIARWNQLDDPTRLRIGQSLNVAPTAGDNSAGATAGTTPVVVGGSIEARPLDSAPTAASLPVPSVAKPTPAANAAEPRAAAVDPSSPWSWPVSGKVVEPFNETRNKGIDIAGQEGEPVLAANEGQVVYSGNSLRGYGNLVIVKHNDDFISAYAHNKQNLVQQGQAVKRGQRIAELGATGTDTPKLHFEIRRQGKPVDPTRYLPARP